MASARGSVATWLALGFAVAAVAALVLIDRRLELGPSERSTALVRQRAHTEKLTTLGNESRQTFVAVLERWLQPPAERAPLRKKIEAMVENVRQLAADFAALDPLDATEQQRREQLIDDLAAWASSMSVSVDSDEGPETANEIHRYFDTVAADIAAVVASVDAAALSAEHRIAELRRGRGIVQVGFGALLLACLGVLWWLRYRIAVEARLAAAEQASLEREQTIKRQSQYFASLSHELRSPLVAIQSYVAELDDDATLSASVRVAVDRIQREAGELLGLINNILDAAKLEAAQMSLLLEPVRLQDVLDRCLTRAGARSSPASRSCSSRTCPTACRRC